MSPPQGDTRVGDRPQVGAPAPAPAPAPDLAAGGGMMATGSDDLAKGPRPASGSQAFAARGVDVALAVLMLLALAAWAQAILHEHFDHDELEHTHVIWLITRGHRPFYDFFECHPPFLWYALGGLLRATGESYNVLFAFRFLSGIFHALFLILVAKNIAGSAASSSSSSPRSSRAAVWWRPLALGFLVLAAQPAVLAYLLEFRLDALPNALLLFATLQYRRSRGAVTWAALRFGLLSSAAVLCSPKLGILLLSFVIFSLLPAQQRKWRLAGMAAGAGAAVVAAIGILLALRLDPVDVFRLSIAYHSLLNRRAGFGHGMASAIWQQRMALAIVVGSAVAFLWRIKGRFLSAPFELAVLSFLIFQLFFVSFPNKQYYGPWFVLGLALFPYLYDALVTDAGGRLLSAVALSAGLAYGGFNVMRDLDHYRHHDPARSEIAARQSLELLVPAGAPVVVSMERRLLFRRDSLYHIASSAAPSGFNTARLMEILNVAGLGARFNTDYYRAEMERMPPALIVQRGWFTIEQQRAIDGYL
ncbi:MAG: hypothetical protein ABIW57_02410, partial [Polyangia bacterium]